MSAGARAPLPDGEVRRRATTDFESNMVVVAGAGSGKTALLVERTLNMIGSGRAALDDVALITFTEKAAADLRRRLQGGLDALARRAAAAGGGGPIDPSEDADRSWEWLGDRGIEPGLVRQRAVGALRTLDRAVVGTIHAFCAEILRQHPLSSRLDPRFSIDEGPGLERQFALAWERYLDRELGPRAKRLDLWRQVVAAGHGIVPVRDLGRAMAGFALPEAALAPYEAPDPRRLLETHVRGVLDLVRSAEPLHSRLAPKARSFLLASTVLLEGFLRDGLPALRSEEAPRPLSELVDDQAPEPGRKLDPDETRAVEAALRASRDLLKGLAGVEEETVGAAIEAGRALAESARERALSRGLVSFDALLRLTRDLLERHPDRRRALGRRHRRILVDEFQDTDPLQYEILFFLAEADGPAAADPYETLLAPGRLFIVGDPKQSVYRFRGADISAFRRAVGHVATCGGVHLTLTTSFRSPEPLLQPINLLFDGWMGDRRGWHGDYEPPYDPIVSARWEGAKAPLLAIWSVPADGPADARRAAEAEVVADWVVRHAGRPFADGRLLAFRDVAILLRALTHAGLYAAALRRAGVPFVVDGGKDFYERPEVGDLLAFLRAAASPNDAPAILAVMRSPLGAVPDDDLARFAADGGRLDRPGDNPAALERSPAVARVFESLAEFRRRALGRPPDEVIQEALGGPSLALLHASTHEGAQRLANLRKLASAAQRHAREGLSLAETLRLAEEEFETAIGEGDSPLADETIDAVRLLSIHKAKGLEYPVVIVPDVGRESDRRPRRPGAEAAWLAGPGGGRLAARLAGGPSNAAWVVHDIERRRHEAAEEKRVLYVACTRAKERLILVNSNPSGTAVWRDRLAALGYRIEEGVWPEDGLLAGGLVEHRVVRAGRAQRLVSSEPAIDPILEAAGAAEEISARAAARARPPLAWPSGTNAEDQAGVESERVRRRAPSASGQVARLAGVAVHAALAAWLVPQASRLDRRPLAPERSALLELGRREAERIAREESSSAERPALLRAVPSETARILEGFLGSSLPARLTAAEILGVEVPILFRDPEGGTWTGACDLLIAEGGSVVVADFKTDQVVSDAPAAAERHRSQLGVYVEAVRRVLPRAGVRGEVLFVRTGESVVLFPGAPDAG